MEKKELPVEVVKEIAYRSDEIYNEINALAVEQDVDNYGLPTFNKVKRPIVEALTAYATKLHQAEEKIKELERDIAEEKRQPELSVKSLRYSLDQRDVSLNEVKKLLDEALRKHEAGLLPDRFIYEKIKTFLYGE